MSADRRTLTGTRYALLRPLGEGAMGEVFLGEHEELGKRVVIKLLRAQLSSRDDLVSRLRQEARLLAQIRHPALVDIYDLSVTADGRPFFVMEYIEGYNLRDFLAGAGGVLTAPHACELMAQALDGLDAAHQRGIVHRDIKPENLLVAQDGRVKILDFGVAKVFGDPTQQHTAAGLVVGTPRYMSPEQARGEPLSPATDLYAVGCVLFELLTGVLPFAVSTAREMLLAHVSTAPPTLAARARSYFDPELEDLVAQALAKDPRRRPVGASVMALQLRRLSARLTGKTTTLTDDKPTVQLDLNAAAIAAQRARDPIDSTTTSPVSSNPVAAQPPPPLAPATPPTERLQLAVGATEQLPVIPTPRDAAPRDGSASDLLSTAATEEAELVGGGSGLRRGVVVVAFAAVGLAAVVGIAAVVVRAYDGRRRHDEGASATPSSAPASGAPTAELPAIRPSSVPTAGPNVAPSPPTASPAPIGTDAPPAVASLHAPSSPLKPGVAPSASASGDKPIVAPGGKPKSGPGAMDDRN